MPTTIQIDNEANALLQGRVGALKKQAARKGRPTRDISKKEIASNLIKHALGRNRPQKKESNDASK